MVARYTPSEMARANPIRRSPSQTVITGQQKRDRHLQIFRPPPLGPKSPQIEQVHQLSQVDFGDIGYIFNMAAIHCYHTIGDSICEILDRSATPVSVRFFTDALTLHKRIASESRTVNRILCLLDKILET